MKKKQSEKVKDILKELPDRDDPAYFNALVANCIRAYEKLSNDGLALDFCRVADKKLRAMVLNDPQYQLETKNIYARQRLEELYEVEDLSKSIGGFDEDDEDDDHYELRDGPKKQKKTNVDRDLLVMQFKAAQMKRDLRAELTKLEGDNERDAVNLMFIPVTAEEFKAFVDVELNEGSDEVDLGELISTEEKMPTSGTGKMRKMSKTEVVDSEGDFFDVLETGEIVEK